MKSDKKVPKLCEYWHAVWRENIQKNNIHKPKED
jgi:hypothetical protein